MLIEKNNKNKHQSRYICDCCKKKLGYEERVIIYREKVGKTKNQKKYDFCDRCYKSFKKSVERKKG